MNWKTFTAAKSKRIVDRVLLCVLVASLFGVGFSCFVTPVSSWVPAPKPIFDKPILTFLTPNSTQEASNQTTILFNVAMPSTWLQSVSESYGSVGPTLWGTIRNVTCLFDQEQVLYNDTVYGRDAKPVVIGSTTVYPPNYPISINYSCELNQLSSGSHSLTIRVAADTFCTNWETVINGYHYPNNYCQDVSANETFTFDVFQPLSASLAESASSVYLGNPVNFTVTASGGKEPYTYAWNVDNQTAEAANSPTLSLTSQAEGEHHVYATVTDANGNNATTLAVAFTALPSPSATPQPSPSPSPSVPENPSWIILPLATISSALLGYFCVRRRKP
jgi:hypothetical protein